MRTLVTGGAGFIGSTLVDRLIAEGHHVDVVDDLSSGSLANLAMARRFPGAFRFHQLDIRAPELVDLVARETPEVIFHLAAHSSVAASVAHPRLDADVNVVGSINVLEAARGGGTRKVVFAASGGSLYGDLPLSELPVGEGAPHRPATPYAVAKKAVLDYLVAYRELFALEFSALALANVYGPRQDASNEGGVVAVFVESLLSGRPCTIYGDGRQTRDFVYVDDAVDAFSRAATKGGGLVINIGSGVGTAIRDLYGIVAREVGSELAPRFSPGRTFEARHSCLSVTRAGIHLGWKPWTSLDDGVRSVVEQSAAHARAVFR